MNRFNFKALALTGLAALLVAGGADVTAPPAAEAADPYTCWNGYVWRDVVPGDKVCVKPDVRDAVATENYYAASNWVNGAYGPKTCRSGLVWRESYAWDLVCTSPQRRADSKQQNHDWCFHAANFTIVRIYPMPPDPCGPVPFNPPH